MGIKNILYLRTECGIFFCVRSEGKPVLHSYSYCKCGVRSLLQVTERARIHRDKATAAGYVVWCWDCCGVATRPHSKACASGLWADGTCRGRAACAGPDFRPSQRDRAQGPKNTTRNILQAGNTATPRGCWAALCEGDCPNIRLATALSVCLA